MENGSNDGLGISNPQKKSPTDDRFPLNPTPIHLQTPVCVKYISLYSTLTETSILSLYSFHIFHHPFCPFLSIFFRVCFSINTSLTYPSDLVLVLCFRTSLSVGPGFHSERGLHNLSRGNPHHFVIFFWENRSERDTPFSTGLHLW